MTIQTSTLSLALAAPLALAIIGYANEARAGLDACGNIHVSAQAECEVLVKGGCFTQCEPVHLQAACAAELTAACDGECRAEASAMCTGSCEGGCVGQCEAQPGEFDCSARCNADCRGECDAACSSDDGRCFAACEGTCSASCDSQCEVTPPSASCEARCEASCQGSCEGEANIDCQIDCQTDGFAECEVDLQGGCKAQCMRPEGALFCDGQYVDVGNDLEECIAALQAELDIEVDGYAEGSCADGSCVAEAGGSISCAVEPDHQDAWWMAAGVLSVLGLVAARRRSE